MKNISVFFRVAVLAVLFAIPAADACTSWVIHPSRSANGHMLVHKCRDSNYSPLDAQMFDLPGGRRYMKIGTVAGWHCFVMNDHGVVAILNAADPVSSRHPGGDRVGYGAGGFLTYAATHCTKADQLISFVNFCADSGII